MEFLILGPLEVRDERGPIALVGAKPRGVLAVLLLHANSPVSAERLAMSLWGDEAPARAVKTVQVHVSRLRKALGDAEAIETGPGGYRLRVRPGELDLERFEQLAGEGRRSLAEGDPERAAAVLRSALALWRGPPLADLSLEPFAQADIARLEEQRLTTVEARVEADLACGLEAELAGELRQLVAEHPTRERLAEQLLLALYRCGRQAEALEAYREAGGRLAELGVDPGPDLRRIHAAILRQDRSLLGDHAAELPRELERATTERLEGRDRELAWLRERWQQAGAGAGGLVTVTGEKGIGKSRLAAELAAEAHDRGAIVLFADAGGPPATALSVLARARRTPGPTLLVVDDADRAPEPVRAELAGLAQAVDGAPVLAVVLGERTGSGADGLELTPLDVAAVHAIVTRYAPDEVTEEPPAEWLMGASRGVPGLVHELARQWARREAGRRVEAGAERTARRRSDLRSMEQRLAADVVVLEAARERAPAEDADGALVCPFKGLATFQVADAPYFFGRERLVAELVARLVGAPLLGIVGPSGSGKSSVLRAGLLPALAAGVLPGSERWHQVAVRPGSHPLAELRDALSHAPAGPVALAVDQFEETFTVCTDEAERAAFLDELARLARHSDGQGVVALAMRADFYGRCAEHPEVSRLLSASHVLVGAMRADELRRAVECPAQRAGLIVDPELVDALVADVEGEPGALPLLSTALLEQWQQREGRRLRHAAYERAGGVRGAVARLGESAYAALDEDGRQIARGVLLRLAAVDEAGGVERRRVAPSELGGEETIAVVRRLADSRLLTIDAGTVELAHEALLREWPRLRAWIEEDRDTLRVYERLRSEAREWQRLERDDGALLRGAQLAEARQWIDPASLDGYAHEFLAASLERERRDRAARRRRVQITIGALAASLVAIAIVAVVAVQKRHDAERERNIALSHSLAAQSTVAVATDPELALRLAMWADELAPTPQSGAALRQATLGFHQRGVLAADALTADTAAYSPDGTRIVTGGDTGVVRLWDAATHRRLAQLVPRHGKVLSARWSADGSRVALGFADGTVTMTDRDLRGARTVLAAGTPANRVAFDPGMTRLAAALDDGTVRVAPLATGEPAVTLGAPGEAPALGVDVDASGRVAAAYADGTVKLWEPGAAQPRQLLRPGEQKEQDVDFSPDGSRLLAVGEDGHARLWNPRTAGRPEDVAVVPGTLTSGAFSPDGSRFATAGWDGVVRVWDTATRSLLFTLSGQRSRVLDVGFGRTAGRLVSAGDDGTARIWDASGLTTVADPTVTQTVDLSPSGRWLATAGRDGAIRLWDAHGGALHRVEPGPSGVTWARFAPASDELTIGRQPTEQVLVWPLAERHSRSVARLPPASGKIVTRFDDSGHRLAYLGQDRPGQIFVRDLRTGRETRLGGAHGAAYEARYSPDGKEVAVSTESGVVLIWRLDHPQAPYRRVRAHAGAIDSIEYSPDGRLVTSSADNTARVTDPRTGRQVVMRGHSAEVYTAAFTPDGARVVSAGQDGTIRLWDSRTGDALAVLDSVGQPIWDLSVGRDGRIVTVDNSDLVRVSPCEVCGSLARVRALAHAEHPRALTAPERRRYLAEAR